MSYVLKKDIKQFRIIKIKKKKLLRKKLLNDN